MSSDLTIRDDQTRFTPAQMTALESLGVEGALPAEVDMFFNQCQRTGLSPWARQIYMIGRWDSKLRRTKYQVQVSIDGLRLVAERTRKYEGQTMPEWCGVDGVWRDVWLENEFPAAARIGVWRDGFREPTFGVARLRSYMPMTKDGKPQGLWRNMPDVMLVKCAEALALRKAFPMELSGLYTTDEMGQDQSIEATVVEPAPEPEPITEAQLTALATLAGKLGLSREQKLAGASYYAGREITTTHDLAKHEASRVIDALKERVDALPEPEPVEAELDYEEAPDEPPTA